LDCEVFKVKILHEIWNEAKLQSEREHVTLYIKNNAGKFRIGELISNLNLSSLRWTLDHPEDFQFIKRIYFYLYKPNKLFVTNDILNLLNKYPQLNQLNTSFKRYEGLLKSLVDDNKKETK
jgi:spore coat polysaccharide biosynthesis protein SpsF